jgi:hypothetical protein
MQTISLDGLTNHRHLLDNRDHLKFDRLLKRFLCAVHSRAVFSPRHPALAEKFPELARLSTISFCSLTRLLLRHTLPPLPVL